MKEPQITIHMGTQRDGHIFGLRPRSRVWLEENYPDRERVSTVFIGVDTGGDFYQIPESILEHVLNMITGLSLAELDKNGGFLIDNPRLGQEVYNSLKAYA